jgi:transposase
MAGDDRLDAEAVARRLRVTVETVYRLVNAGECRASKGGP